MTIMASRLWMIYGAYGFTGGLLVEEALRRGHQPLVAGRDPARLSALAERHGLPGHPLSLDDPAALRAAASGVDLIVNAAGPFSETGLKLIETCLATGTSYMDLSGEIGHLRFVETLDARAQAAGITLLTGAGFGVTYGDCLARRAVGRLPDATRLRLSVASANAQTTPTARRTVMSVLAQGGYAVEGGEFRRRRLAHQRWTIRTASSNLAFAAAPLGELAALRRSTGVADIVVGVPMAVRAARALRFVSPILRSALSIPAVLRFAGRDRADPIEPAGEPAGGWRSRVWAEASNDRGDTAVSQLETIEGYKATAEAALANVEALFANRPKGVFTPALAFGAELLASLPHAKLTDIDLDADADCFS